jgi:hypothetical protein
MPGPDDFEKQMLEVLNAPEGEMTVGEPEVIKTPKSGLEQFAEQLTNPDALAAMNPYKSTLADDPRGALAAGMVDGASLGTVKPPDMGQANSPVAAQAGELAGSALLPFAKLVKGGGMVAGAINGAANAGAQGAVRGFSASDGSLTQKFDQAISSGADAAEAGGMLGGAAGALASPLEKLGGWLSDQGTNLRNTIFGPAGERLGVGAAAQDLGLVGIPKSAAGYAAAAAPIADQYGAQRAGALAQAQQEIPPGAVQSAADDATQRMGQRIAPTANSGLVGADSQARAMTTARNGMAMEGADPRTYETPADLASMTKRYADKVDYAAPALTDQSAASSAHEAAAEQLRNSLSNVMAQASPETNAAFVGSTKPYGQAADVMRYGNEAGSSVSPAMSLGLGAAGYGLGSMVGHPYLGAMLGAGAGSQAVRQAGTDAAASATQLTGAGMSGLGNMANWITQGGATGPMVAAMNQGQLPSSSGQAADSGNTPGQQLSQITADAQPTKYPAAVQQLLRSDPGALGSYTQQFQDVLNAGDMQDLIDRLSVTDPQFRSTVLPKIQQLSGRSP